MANEPCVARNPVDRKYYATRFPEGSFREAQLVTPEDISEIEAVVVLDEVLGFAAPEQRLRPLCTVIRMPELTMRVDVGTLRTGSPKVPPMVEAELKADAYVPVPFELWKNVDHIAFSDEAVKKAHHDIVRLSTQKSGIVMGAMENSQIAEALATLTDQVGADWGDKSGEESVNNPFDDIVAALAALQGLGYSPDRIAMHPDVWADFIANDYVQKYVHAGMITAGAPMTLPGYPNVQRVIDAALTNTTCYVLDSRAPTIALGEGPTEAERYRHVPAGFTGYLIRQWLQPKVAISGAGLEITGVHVHA